jgi:hypothetical protein
LEKYLQHLLDIGGNRPFRNDILFLLNAFSILNKERLDHALFQTVYFKKEMVQRGFKATTHEYETLLKYQQQVKDAHFKNETAPPKPLNLDAVFDLQKGIESVERVMFDTAKETLEAQSKAFSMTYKHGRPALYLTLSPDSNSKYAIQFLSNKGFDYPTIDELLTATNEDYELMMKGLPNKTQMKAFASDHPYACYEYFKSVIDNFVTNILCYSADKNNQKEGLFGYASAYMYSVESQQSGNLHAHFIIWLHGWPISIEETIKAINNENSCNDIIESIDSRVCCNLPCDKDPVTCPHCNCPLIEMEPSYDYFQKDTSKEFVIIAKCSSIKCNRMISLKKYSELVYETITANLTDMEKRLLEDRFVAFMNSNNEPLQHGEYHALLLRLTLSEYQIHDTKHRPSCFKKSSRCSGNCCRFFFPKQLFKQTYRYHQLIRLKRSLGNEFTNNYNLLIAMVFKCNHDIQYITATAAPSVIYYVIKYVSKVQQKIESLMKIHIEALQKCITKEPKSYNQSTPDERLMFGKRRLRSMLLSVTNPQETAAPLAVYYLRHQTRFKFSHDFVYVNVKQCLHHFTSNSVPFHCQTNDNQEHKPTGNYFYDYLNRPSMLRQMSLYDYMETYEKKKSKSGVPLNPNHFQADSHSLFKRNCSVVLNVMMGSIKILDKYSTDDDLKGHYQTLVVLFCPRLELIEWDSLNSLQLWYQSIEKDQSQQRYLSFYSDKLRANSKKNKDPEIQRLQAIKTRSSKKNLADTESENNDSDISDTESDFNDFDLQLTNDINILAHPSLAFLSETPYTFTSQPMLHVLIPDYNMKQVKELSKNFTRTTIVSLDTAPLGEPRQTRILMLKEIDKNSLSPTNANKSLLQI